MLKNFDKLLKNTLGVLSRGDKEAVGLPTDFKSKWLEKKLQMTETVPLVVHAPVAANQFRAGFIVQCALINFAGAQKFKASE